MKILKLSVLAACCVMTTGCSTLTKDSHQPVAISSKSLNGETITGANCLLKNDKGSGSTVTPTTVKLKRSSKDLLVHCRKPGYPDGHLRAISRATGSLYGNAIFGGILGAGIDHTTGKAYDYPSQLEVVMGNNKIADRRSVSK